MYNNILNFAISFIAIVATAASTIYVQHSVTKQQKYKDNNDFIYKHHHEVIENYLKNLGKYIHSDRLPIPEDYASSFGEIYMYAPSELWDKITEIHDKLLSLEKSYSVAIAEHIRSSLKTDYSELCKAFAVFPRDEILLHQKPKCKWRKYR